MRVVAILGSARSDGDAAALLDVIFSGLDPARGEVERVDLAALRIHDYVYDATPEDDFRAAAEAMVQADAVLFVTPVYWYAMSGGLKRFFDRLTELTDRHRTLGRQLAGRSAWMAACGTRPALPEGFEVPFRETAAYFGMAYGSAFYAQIKADEPLSDQQAQAARAFGEAVFREGRDRWPR